MQSVFDSNFVFNSRIRQNIHWVVQLLGNKAIERFVLTSHTELNSFLTFSILFLNNKEN